MLPLSALALAMTPPTVVNEYRVSFDNRAHHEAQITARFDALPGGPLTLRMARSSPGRYALHEFAKNVDDVTATDSSGKALTVVRNDPYSWDVAGHDGSVIVTYTLFGDRGDGTYAQIDTSHAHLNGPATFMYADGLFDREATVKFDTPDPEWHVSTQLIPTGTPTLFIAPSTDYLMDSPIEVSEHEVRTWNVRHKDEHATIRLAIHSNAPKPVIDDYEAKVRKIVDEEIALWDDIPDYDHGTYTFLVDYFPWVDGDGMEHRNSTVITGSRAAGSDSDLPVSVVAHEFFHGWNVERLRPRDLQPFDFNDADVSQHLWFAEGFTSYYDGLFLHRAGIVDEAAMLEDVAGMIQSIRTSPARPGSGAAEMSRLAPFMDAATSNDPTDYFNSKLSYYTYGSALGLGLDLKLRTTYGTSLDAYMRALWQRFGKTEQPYTDDDLIAVLGEVSGDAAFARTWFAEMVHGDGVPDYAAMLPAFGLQLGAKNAGKGSVGFMALDHEDDKALISFATIRGTPLYEAGLSLGDEIVAVNGKAIDSKADWTAATSSLKAGQTVTIDYVRRGERGQASVEAAPDPALAVVSLASPTNQQLAMRKAWLGSSR